MRAQIQVLSPNPSFSGPTEIPNSFEIPKNYFDFNFCISSILISGNEVTEFQSFYLTKLKFLQTGIFTKIPSYTSSFICFQCTACIRKRGHGISKFLFDEIEVSPNSNFHQDSVLYILIHLLPMHCMHPSTMDVPELKLPSWRWWTWRNTESVEDKKKEDNDEPDSLHCTRAPRT